MIQPQPAQRGVIGQQHGLQRLTDTLEALSRGQTAQQQRDTQLQEQLTTQAQQLARLTTGGKRLLLAVLGLGVLTLGLGGLVGWQVTHWPDMAYARDLGAVDATLVQQWGESAESHARGPQCHLRPSGAGTPESTQVASAELTSAPASSGGVLIQEDPERVRC